MNHNSLSLPVTHASIYIYTYLCRYDLQTLGTGGILNGFLQYSVVMFRQSHTRKQVTQDTLQRLLKLLFVNF